jgi:hypothetical protein
MVTSGQSSPVQMTEVGRTPVAEDPGEARSGTVRVRAKLTAMPRSSFHNHHFRPLLECPDGKP